MPAIVALLMRGLLWASGSIAGQVLVALGIGVVSYTGVDLSLSWAKSQAIAALQGMGAEYVALLSYMKVGVCINIITSAMVMRAGLNGLTGGTFKRFVKR